MRVDWYLNVGLITHTAQHSSEVHRGGKIDGFNLDFSTSKISIDELKAMSKPQQPETSEARPEIKPEVRPKTNESLLQLIIDFLIRNKEEI